MRVVSLEHESVILARLSKGVFLLVYFSGLKYIFAHQILHFSQQNSSASEKCACLDFLSSSFLSREASDVHNAHSSSMANGKVQVSITASDQMHSV